MEEAKLSLFVAGDMIELHRKLYRLHQKLLDLISEFGKTAGCKSIFKIKGIFVYQQQNIRSRNQEKNPICYSNKKNKVPRNKPNQGGKRPMFRKLHNSEERN